MLYRLLMIFNGTCEKRDSCSVPPVPQQGYSHFLLQILFFSSPSLFVSRPALSVLLVSLQVNGMRTKKSSQKEIAEKNKKNKPKELKQIHFPSNSASSYPPFTAPHFLLFSMWLCRISMRWRSLCFCICEVI